MAIEPLIIPTRTYGEPIPVAPDTNAEVEKINELVAAVNAGLATSNAIVGGDKFVQYRLSQLFGVPPEAMTLDRLDPATILPGVEATVINSSDSPMSSEEASKSYVATIVPDGTTAGAFQVPAYTGATDLVWVAWQEVVDNSSFTPLLASELNPGKAAYADKNLRPLLIALANGIGTGTSTVVTTPTTTPATTGPTVTGFLPDSGAVGASITLTGTGFTKASAVLFNGTPASFQVINATTIIAVVPIGATNGPVAVTNSAGTGTSAANFTVSASPVTTPTTPVGTAFTAALAISVASIVAGNALTFEVTAGGGTAPYTYAVKATNNATGAVTILGSSAAGSFTPQSGGVSYNIDATVTDNAGKMVQAVTRSVTVTNPQAVNQIPVATAGQQLTIQLPTSSAALMGSGSDPDPGDTFAYAWRQITGPNIATGMPATSANVVVSNLVEGTYQFGLKTIDNHGAQSNEAFSVVTVLAQAVTNPGPSTRTPLLGYGQSNMEGYSLKADLSSEQLAPLNLTRTFANTYMYYRGTGALDQLRFGVNQYGGPTGYDDLAFGFEIGFADSVEKLRPGSRVDIAKYGIGGQTVDQLSKGNSTGYYEAFVAQALGLKAIYTQAGLAWNPPFLYNQGESGGSAADWPTKTKTLFDNLTADGAITASSKIIVVIPQGSVENNVSAMRANVLSLVNLDSRVQYIDAAQYSLHDQYHYDGVSMNQHGSYDVYNAVFGISGNSPSYVSAPQTYQITSADYAAKCNTGSSYVLTAARQGISYISKADAATKGMAAAKAVAVSRIVCNTNTGTALPGGRVQITLNNVQLTGAWQYGASPLSGDGYTVYNTGGDATLFARFSGDSLVIGGQGIKGVKSAYDLSVDGAYYNVTYQSPTDEVSRGRFFIDGLGPGEHTLLITLSSQYPYPVWIDYIETQMALPLPVIGAGVTQANASTIYIPVAGSIVEVADTLASDGVSFFSSGPKDTTGEFLFRGSQIEFFCTGRGGQQVAYNVRIGIVEYTINYVPGGEPSSVRLSVTGLDPNKVHHALMFQKAEYGTAFSLDYVKVTA
jgi:hypothetical protein